MAERLEIDYNALHVYQYVASKYELVMRITSLSFNHHQIAAPLDDRLEWLQKAAQGEFIVANIPEEGTQCLGDLIKSPTITLAQVGIDRNDSPKFRFLATQICQNVS